MKILFSILAAIIITLPASIVLCMEVGTFSSVDGEVLIFKENEFLRRAVKGLRISEIEEVRTGVDSYAKIILLDDTIISLDAETQFFIAEYLIEKERKRCLVNLLKGRMRSLVVKDLTKKSTFEIKSPTAVVGVRGTDFIVNYRSVEKKTEVVVITGLVSVKNIAGSVKMVLVRTGYATTVHKGRPPSPPKKVDVEKFKGKLGRSKEKGEEEEIKEVNESTEDVKAAETKALGEEGKGRMGEGAKRREKEDVEKAEEAEEMEEVEEAPVLEAPELPEKETNVPPVKLEPPKPVLEVTW